MDRSNGHEQEIEPAVTRPIDTAHQDSIQARRWRQLERHREDLARWLIDEATDSAGNLTAGPIDAALLGDDYVPCTFSFQFRGRRYRMSLLRTLYSVTEV